MNPLFSFVEEEEGLSHPRFCRRILEERGKRCFCCVLGVILSMLDVFFSRASWSSTLS